MASVELIDGLERFKTKRFQEGWRVCSNRKQPLPEGDGNGLVLISGRRNWATVLSVGPPTGHPVSSPLTATCGSGRRPESASYPASARLLILADIGNGRGCVYHRPQRQTNGSHHSPIEGIRT